MILKRPALVALAALLAASSTWLLGAGEGACEEGPAVLYSYEKFVVGNDVQYVLVPRTSKMTVNTDAQASPAVINGLFNELRDHKRATYGSTSIDATPASLKKGQVTVKVDTSKEKYFVIISAEVVHTLAGAGVTSVVFPGLAKKPLAPSDIEFGVYALHIPAWRALPPKRIEPATIMLPDGSEQASSSFYGAIEKKDPAVGRIIEAYLKREEVPVVVASLRALPTLKLPEWEKIALPALEHADASVRTAAIEIFVGNDAEPVLQALVKVMDKDKDEAVRRKAAEVLGGSKNRRFAAYALYFQLRGGDEASSIKAIDELIKLKEPTAVEEMVRAARGEREAVAIKGIEALGSLEATAELRKLFDDAKLALTRRQAAAGQLQGAKDEEARLSALSFLAVQGAEPDAKAAIDALGKLKDARPKIEAALGHPSSPVRRYAAEALAVQKDPASLKPMAAAAEAHAEDEEAIQTSASVIMGGLSLTDLLTYTSIKNVVLQRVAYEALGSKAKGGNKKVFDVLAEGIKHKDGGIRAASARALGAFGDDKALKLLLDAGKDGEGKVRRNIAVALANWPAGEVHGRPLLLEYLKDSEPTVVVAAVDAFRLRKESEVFAQLVPLYRNTPHPDARVRGAALRALHEVGLEPQKDNVISILSGGLYDKDPAVKALAIELLGNYDNAMAVTGLASLINDPDEKLRVSSLAALGRTHSTDAVELIVSVINDPNKKVRLAAVEALGENGRPAAGDALKKQLTVEKDPEILAAIKVAQKKIK